jgi:hypothetical protein
MCDAGPAADFDAAALGDAIANVLAVAYELPRDDFVFHAAVQASA